MRTSKLRNPSAIDHEFHPDPCRIFEVSRQMIYADCNIFGIDCWENEGGLIVDASETYRHRGDD